MVCGQGCQQGNAAQQVTETHLAGRGSCSPVQQNNECEEDGVCDKAQNQAQEMGQQFCSVDPKGTQVYWGSRLWPGSLTRKGVQEAAWPTVDKSVSAPTV